MSRRRRAAREIAHAANRIAATGVAITPNDTAIIMLALQSRVRDMHAAGKHEAAEAALITLNKINALKEAAR